MQPVADTSDLTLASLLKQLQNATNLNEVRQHSRDIERVVFHGQFENA